MTDMARLGLDERFGSLTQTQGQQIVGVLTDVLAEFGLSAADETLRLAVFSRLRLVAGS